MSVPAAYSEQDLLTYLVALLGKTATDLGWTTANVAEAYTDTLILYGVSSVGSATDIGKLRACARLAAWRAVEAETAPNYHFSTDGQSFHREQIHEHAVAMVKRARVEAQRHGIEHSVSTLRVTRRDDPYVTLTDDERSTAS